MTYERLREIRNKKGVSARDLAIALNLKTEAAYYKKEAGMIRFSLEEAKIVADRLQMSINDIFFEEEVSAEETNEQATGTDG